MSGLGEEFIGKMFHHESATQRAQAIFDYFTDTFIQEYGQDQAHA